MSVDQETALRTLLNHQAKLTAFAWSIVRDRHTADDVFQEVLIRAARSHGDIESLDHLLNWARTVARRVAIDLLRADARRPLALDDDVLHQLEHDWRQHDDRTDDRTAEALEHCMKSLTDRTREVLRLRYSEGLTGEQVAFQLNRPAATIYQLLTRTYRTLADCIRRRINE